MSVEIDDQPCPWCDGEVHLLYRHGLLAASLCTTCGDREDLTHEAT